MNQYPLWKYLSLLVALMLGILYALPNLYGDDPVVQVASREVAIDASLREQVEVALTEAGVPFSAVDIEPSHVVARFADTDIQLAGQEALVQRMGEKFSVSLNLESATPKWLRAIGAKPMYLGLDLRGGVHFLLQVDMDSALKQRMESYTDAFRSVLIKNKLRYGRVQPGADRITLGFRDAAVAEKAQSTLENEFPDLKFTASTFTSPDPTVAATPAAGVTPVAGVQEVVTLVATMREEVIKKERSDALTQNIVTLRNRVNDLGVAEPIIQQQGTDRIIVQLPGVQDTAEAKRRLGNTATLEYRLIYGTPSDWARADQSGAAVPVDAKLYRDRDGKAVLLRRSLIVTGDSITSASAGFDPTNGQPAVFVNLDGKGADRMSEVTGQNINKDMAVVFIEYQTDTKEVDGKLQISTNKKETVISIATIRDQLSRRFQTTGVSTAEAQDLALSLRSGALKAPMKIVEERTVGPSLGRDNIDNGLKSVMIGFIAVFVFMILNYKTFGLLANITLAVNVVLLVAILSLLQATLTMPGIAGIVLTVGMAVDANVLIYERIREEIRLGNSVQAAIHAGFDKAFATITDSNVTTLIAALAMLSLGSGPVRGFAVTLALGILTSMFTAVVGTRAMVNLLYGGRTIKRLSI